MCSRESQEGNTCEGPSDRDERFLLQACGRGAQLVAATPKLTNGKRPVGWGGAMRRMQSAVLAPSREDDRASISVPGRYVPLGFAKYVSPVVDPSSYNYYRVAGWRVAVPRSTPGFRTRDLLYRIFYHGPQSAGYVRVGDTLTPAILEPGDRMTLAQSSIGFYDSGLSP